MKLIDTHAHLQFKAYDTDRDEVVKRNSQELGAVVNVGTSVEASEKGIKLAEKVDNFYASVAVHPHHVDQWNDETYKTLKSLGQHEKVVAVGEVGLDNHFYKPLRVLRSNELQGYPKPNLKKQAKILEAQINLARELGKPILFHCRDAYDELYEQIKIYKGTVRGLMHCYMGTWNQAERFLDLGLYISFSGNLTYSKNDYIREVAKKVPKDRILVETDAPYLPPEPFRGKRNEPSYVKIVVTQLEILRSDDKIGQATVTNAKELLKLK